MDKERKPKRDQDAISAALEAAQHLAAEADAEQAATDAVDALNGDPTGLCDVCGHRNRGGNRYCGMCGCVLPDAEGLPSASPEQHLSPALRPSSRPAPSFPGAPHEMGASHSNRNITAETHHYHHHYHHHYFPGGHEAMLPRGASDAVREAEKMRPGAALRGDMSRAEAAVRRITQEWVLSCNTKHLDDLLELYVADALVLRSNYPPQRGAAAVREFFLGALDAGLGEVEMEPLRVEVIGDLAYEAGRCKALVPSATGKRREERGKYLWVCARQPNGEWKLAADCWSSDLSLTLMESDVPAGAVVKTKESRKS